jgi:hypothetical protein
VGNGYDTHIDDRLLRAEPAPSDAHLDIEICVDAQVIRMLVPMGAPASKVALAPTTAAARIPIDA